MSITWSAVDEARRGRPVLLLAAATFLIFFQAYMVAPLQYHAGMFSAVQLVAAVAAIPLFHAEARPSAPRP